MTQPTMTYSRAFQEGMREEMSRDPNIIVLGTDLFLRGGHWAQVKGLGPEFGEDRVRDTPISEAAMMAAGVGAALNGLRPVVDLNFIDFVFGAIDELVNQAAKIHYMWGAPVPLVVRATSGVAFGGPQHNNQIEAWFAHTPGLTVVAPADAADAKGLIKSALRSQNPTIFLMHKALTGRRGTVGGPDDLVPLGVASRRRSGTDLTIVSYGVMTEKALKASESLAAEGVEVDLIDLRTVWPVDLDLIADSVRKTGHLLVVSEAPLAASVSSHIAAQIQEAAFDYLDAPTMQLGAQHVPIPHSPVLFPALVPQVVDIHAAALRCARYSISAH